MFKTFNKTTHFLLSDLISISHKHQKKYMIFAWDQNTKVINVMELNIAFLIVIEPDLIEWFVLSATFSSISAICSDWPIKRNLFPWNHLFI